MTESPLSVTFLTFCLLRRFPATLNNQLSSRNPGPDTSSPPLTGPDSVIPRDSSLSAIPSFRAILHFLHFLDFRVLRESTLFSGRNPSFLEPDSVLPEDSTFARAS